ncbi:MAG: CPBP family intramembrane metalloprotease domain-containing protein [Acidobacteria bacterium]|nr:MAG: CPBP family intramembrane metalloprotease domain-containing protein [Acidobacteriota bacterium]
MLVYTRAPNRIWKEAALKKRFLIVSLLYAGLLIALWFGFRRSPLAASLDGNFSRAFASFAILLAPLWFMGFDTTDLLRRLPRPAQVAIATLFALPYFVFNAGTAAFGWQFAAIMIALPVVLSAIVAVPGVLGRMHWRDGIVIAAITVTYFLKLLSPAWGGLTFFPKLFLADIVLYCFLVVRALEGTGYSLVPTGSAVWTGMRELVFYVPLAIVAGESVGFIHFHPAADDLDRVIGAVLLTFLLIAIPEELFFRSILQNILESRFGRRPALLLAAAIFGLSHFNHGPGFNWKYVLLASVAGIFYGRAWRANRQIFASVVTHTAVDVVWLLWFR